jgi:hypothetical protein
MRPLTTPIIVKGSISRCVMPGLHWFSYIAINAVLSSFTSRYSIRPARAGGGGHSVKKLLRNLHIAGSVWGQKLLRIRTV